MGTVQDDLRDAVSRRNELTRRFREVNAAHEETRDVDTRAELDSVNAELNATEAEIGRLVGQLPAGAWSGPTQPPGNRTVSPGDASRDQALRAIEGVQRRSAGAPDVAFERAERLVTAADPRTARDARAWVTVTANEAYERAFAKLCSDPTRGHLLWTAEETQAYRDVEEYRAMSLTDTAGGHMVPFTLDPAVMLTSDGSINPLRRISRVVQTTTDTWNGVTSAGVTNEWLAEATQAADASPTLGQPNIPVHKGSAFVPFSYEVGMDAANFLPELRTLMLDGADQLQATAHTTGTGIGQPSGVIPDATVVNNASGAFVAADVYTLQNALPPRFQARAQFAANLAVINKISQFETTNGSKVFPEVGDDRLLRKPLNELSNMSGDFSTTSSKFLLYGDFQAGFVVVDRVGSTLELIPNIFGAAQRPTGQRGAFLWYRVGSDVVVPQALRVLNKTA